MGYIMHEAIVVTGDSYNWKLQEEPDCPQDIHNIRKAIYNIYKECDSLEGNISDCVGEICGTGMNGTYAFLIAPDGSKEGWGLSQKGDDAREKAIKYLETTARHDDGSGCDYCYIRYGGDYKYDGPEGDRSPHIIEWR